jgi:hypothetical protein
MRQGVLGLLAFLLSCPLLASQELLAPLPPAPPTSTLGSRWQFDGEYLWWYLRKERVPPLLTTGPDSSQGVLGQPGTQILYGEEKIKSRHDRFIGARLGATWWASADQTWGLEVRGFFLERDSTNFTIKPTTRLLARPYLDANTGQQASEIISGRLPNGDELLGSFNAYSRIELFGQEVNSIHRLWENENLQVEGGWGGRFLQLRHRLDLTSSGRVQPELITLYGVSDHFQTFNKFYGGQVGLRGEVTWDRFFLRSGGTIAVGGTDEEIRTKATRLTHTQGFREERPLGLYVLPTNTGRYRRVVVDVVSEGHVTLGCHLTEHVTILAGYSFLHWLNPVRSGGDQIEPINTQHITGGPLTGPAAPAMPFKDDFFWAQGLSVGVECTW